MTRKARVTVTAMTTSTALQIAWVSVYLVGCSASAGGVTAGGSAGYGAGGAGTPSGGNSTSGGATPAGGSIGSGGTSVTGGTGAGGSGETAIAGAGGGTHVTPPPKQVLACDDLKGSPLGQWEQVPLDPTIGHVAALVLDPVRSGTVYFGAGAGTNVYGGPSLGPWKTTDCGADWSKIKLGENAALLESGLQWIWAIDRDHPDTIYANSGYGGGGVYRSDNAGVDWKDITPALAGVPKFIALVGMDLTNPTHLVVTFHDNCTGEFAPMCLAESRDRGETWRAFKGPSPGWQEGAGPVVLGPTTWLYAAPAGGLFYTKDSGTTWEQVADNANAAGFYVSSDGKSFICSDHGVLTSKDQHVWTHLDNSPKCTALASDGVTLYASHANDYSGRPFYSAPLSDPTSWTNMPSPPIPNGGGYNMGYDPDHNVIYSANCQAGMWRLRVR